MKIVTVMVPFEVRVPDYETMSLGDIGRRVAHSVIVSYDILTTDAVKQGASYAYELDVVPHPEEAVVTFDHDPERQRQ